MDGLSNFLLTWTLFVAHGNKSELGLSCESTCAGRLGWSA